MLCCTKTPTCGRFFSEAEFLYAQPEVINEISFAPKQPVEQHVLMCGDAAGLITPLCGNGMAMALHGAALAANAATHRILAAGRSKPAALGNQPTPAPGKQHFGARLRVGRAVQRLFGGPVLERAAWWWAACATGRRSAECTCAMRGCTGIGYLEQTKPTLDNSVLSQRIKML